jgi:hypothetical protein
VGKTNDIRRRLRQHNGMLAGGAKATRGRGPWTLAWYVTGFRSETDALRFEWRLHHPPVRRTGVGGRWTTLVDVCSLSRWTSRAPLAATVPLRVHVLHDVDASMVPSVPHVTIYCNNIHSNAASSGDAE